MLETPLFLNGEGLSLELFAEVVHGGRSCALSPEARRAMAASAAVVAGVAAGTKAVYGINTGFGNLAGVRITPDKLSTLQHRLLLSHAAGVGEPLAEPVVRGMLLLRANALARGRSGIRIEVVERLLAHLEHNLLPVVPSQGSVGASGDLAPLAHLALPLIGAGKILQDGHVRPSAEVLAEIGWLPMELGPKEGLALINGTQAMTSTLATVLVEARRLVRAADLFGALSTDALRGTDAAFDPRIHEVRNQPGQKVVGANLAALLKDSAIRESHRVDDVRVQDPYSIRCMPQVHGAVRDTLQHVEGVVERELNAVTDNPLVFSEDGAVVSGGNFHGEPIALVADFLAIALAELGSISERRIEKLTNAAFSALPPFLVEDAGLNSGFMIAHVVAAALVSENKVLAHPASVDSIPTSADKEDHVSMGMGAVLKLQRVVVNLRRVLAIELLAAGQGVDLLRPLHSSEPLEALHAALRERVRAWDRDREMSPDIETAETFLDDGLDAFLVSLE